MLSKPLIYSLESHKRALTTGFSRKPIDQPSKLPDPTPASCSPQAAQTPPRGLGTSHFLRENLLPASYSHGFFLCSLASFRPWFKCNYSSFLMDVPLHGQRSLHCFGPASTTGLNVEQLFSCSVTSNSVTSWTIACQAPLSMGFPRQEYWSRLPFPSPR